MGSCLHHAVTHNIRIFICHGNPQTERPGSWGCFNIQKGLEGKKKTKKKTQEGENTIGYKLIKHHFSKKL